MHEIPVLGVEEAVQARYRRGAEAVQPELCCAPRYDRRLLDPIPAEIIERDYGCGDPTPYVQAGDTVLDLGSGSGKLCYIAAQLAGPAGRVIGIDCTPEMLALARKYQDQVAERLGYANVEFRCGMIQDLRLDLDLLAAELADHPVRDQAGWLSLRRIEDRLRAERPLIADDSIDVVLSSCVLNLVRPGDKRPLFEEIARVLKPGGRAAISDIVAGADVPLELQHDPELWSGCISGALREDQFLDAFERAGLYGVTIVSRSPEPWRIVGGIEFRSMTVVAYKPPAGRDAGSSRAVIYRGPFKAVEDEAGHRYLRGRPTPVGDATFAALGREPYAGLFERLGPPAGAEPDAGPEACTEAGCSAPGSGC